MHIYKITIFFIIGLFWENGGIGQTVHQFHHPEAFNAKIKKNKQKGALVYKQYCANCHAKNPLINLGAPRIGMASEWQNRTKQSFSLMFKKVNEGFNAMPARGGCFECSDEALKQAVIYLLPKKQKRTVKKG